MSKRTVLGYLAIVFFLVSILPMATGEVRGEELKLRMSAFFSNQSPAFKPVYTLPAEMIEKATNGRAKVTIFPSNSLVPVKDLYQAIQTGVADVGWVWGPATPGAFPLTDIFSLPGFAANQATSNFVVNELFNRFPEMEKQFSPAVKHISTQVHMRTDLHSTTPIRSLADLKGLVIACQTDKDAKAMSLLGASATQMQVPEMYTAVERGVVKGTVQAWGSVQAQHMDEVEKYHTLIGVSCGTSHWIWNRKTWDKFTPEEQAKLELLAPTFQNFIVIGNVWNSITVRTEKVIPANGHELITWSDEDMQKMKKIFKPMWDEWAEEMEAKGFPGKEILKEAIKFMNAYIYG